MTAPIEIRRNLSCCAFNEVHAKFLRVQTERKEFLEFNLRSRRDYLPRATANVLSECQVTGLFNASTWATTESCWNNIFPVESTLQARYRVQMTEKRALNSLRWHSILKPPTILCRRKRSHFLFIALAFWNLFAIDFRDDIKRTRMTWRLRDILRVVNSKSLASIIPLFALVQICAHNLALHREEG